jgi:ribokinase
MSEVKILVIGSINMDLLLLTPRMPRPGETLVSEKYQFSPGGKGANQAVACAMMGGNTTFVGKVGADSFGEQLRKALQNKNINTAFLGTSESNSTGFAVILLEDGNNRIISHLAANLDITRADLDHAFGQNSYDGMLINFEIAEDIVIYACEKAREKGIPFFVDAGPACQFPLESIPGAEIFSPNETETHSLTGITPANEKSYEEAAKILQTKTDAKHIVLKLGEHGAYHYHKHQGTCYPPHTVQAVDATAAGDVFTAAMLVQYLQHGDIAKSIRYANAAGALTVTRAGAQESIPTKSMVEEILI